MRNGQSLLRVGDLRVRYLKKEILCGVNIDIREREIVGVVGSNGAGKSTLLSAIFGLARRRRGDVEGRVLFNGDDISSLEVYQRAGAGIGYLLQGGKVFTNLSVDDNLSLGAHHSDDGSARRKGFIYSLFPALRSLQQVRAGLLSGGERQMLALGVVLMPAPKLLLLDEPTAGLSPEVVGVIGRAIKEAREADGSAALLVEQNIDECLAVSDWVYLLRGGEVVGEDSPVNLVGSNQLENLFFA